MIPVAQLDPATLTLWLNTELIAQHPAHESIQKCLTHAVSGDVDGLKTAVQSMNDDEEQTRCVHLASAIWHEQRHFLDLVLTNYGAFRFRQFTSVYWNIHALLKGLGDVKQPLLCPITVYSDPIRSEALQANPPTEEMAQQAADIRTRMRMVAEEQTPIPTPWGPMQLGGEAQLEALGYLYQFAAIGKHFGPGMVLAVQEDLPTELRGNLRYKWALLVGQRAGILPAMEVGENLAVLDVNLLCAVLMGSLAVRRWGQEQVKNADSGDSGYAAGRLYGFMAALQGRKYDFGTLGPQDAWDEVNELAKTLWGRTAITEMEIDFELEEQRLQSTLQHTHSEDVRAVLTSVHELRRRLVQLMREDPTLILDQERYSEALLPLLLPLPVRAQPSGVLGHPPGEWERVLGYSDPDDPEDPNGRWWWAAAPSRWPPKETPYVLSGREAWVRLVADLGPLAKLLMHGHRHDTMLGPEVLSIEMRLSDDYNFEVDPFYRFPSLQRRNAANHYYYLTGKDTASCDSCRSQIHPGNTWVVSPWRFRMNMKLAELAIEGFGGGREGHLRFVRDWSIWIVCRKCHDLISQVERATSS